MNRLRSFQPTNFLTICLTVCLTGGLSGCGSDREPENSTESENEIVASDLGLDADDLVFLENSEMPNRLPDAVLMLETMRDNIRDGLVNDDIDAAHGPLHEVGHLLEHLQKQVENSDLDENQKTAANEAIEQLFDSFGSIDGLIHDDEPVDYSVHSDKIDSAISTLSQLK
ncbi:hypothetical protein Q31b_09640 [Novipirellula aureliae]|uniref:Uncharacterized protein n=1 Tax=Novipirellula aureliae TaxID=2527966 RepID=A0A5C6EAA9_9BACT|nr:hypothetical protein [Novipirellula aureliae]TWU45788.1 hypothetical protein Q31b_09640 [Novipirellula aureliae]